MNEWKDPKSNASAPKAPLEGDVVAAIVGASREPPNEWPMLGQTLLLRFQDERLETAYLQAQYTRNQRQIIASSIVAASLIAGFYWLDPIVAPPDAVNAIQWARLLVGIPAGVGLVAGSLTIRRVAPWMWLSSLLFLIYLLKQTGLLLLLGPNAFNHLGQGVVDGLIGLLLISNLPLRHLIGISGFSMASFIAGGFFMRVDARTMIESFAADATLAFVFTSFAVYRYERASRFEFVAQATAQLSYERRLAAEADRRRWLEVFARFLSHELKTAMVGISSSIDLASRTGAEATVERYFARARRSLNSMRRLLAQVTNATGLESALDQQASETFDLAPLVRDRVDDFRDEHPDRQFDVRADGNTLILGSPDAMLQMIDKLISNAIEHGARSKPIRIELTKTRASCSLTVSDVGSSLPDDLESIFRPFVSEKKTPTANGNLGLGLFVARTIAAHHRGSVHAEPLKDAVGACFTVELPLAEP